MRYPIAIEWGDDNTATGIVFPDIPGAISAGDSPEEAYDNAVEAAHIVLQELVSRGESIPKPGKINEHRRNPDFEGWGWGMIDIDLTGVKSRSAFLSNSAAHPTHRREA